MPSKLCTKPGIKSFCPCSEGRKPAEQPGEDAAEAERIGNDEVFEINKGGENEPAEQDPIGERQRW